MTKEEKLQYMGEALDKFLRTATRLRKEHRLEIQKILEDIKNTHLDDINNKLNTL